MSFLTMVELTRVKRHRKNFFPRPCQIVFLTRMAQHTAWQMPAHNSGIRHLGIIVADIEKARAMFSSAFGIGPWYAPRFAQGEHFLRGTQRIHTQYQLASAFSGGVEFQLIQVLGGDHDVCAEFLQEHGPGIHHIGIYVNDLGAHVAAYAKQGIGVLQSGHLPASGTTRVISKYAYLDTVHISGLVLELLELKWLGIPLRPSRWLYEFGRLTQSISRLQSA